MRQVPAIGVLPVAAVDRLTREGCIFVGAAGDMLLRQGSEGDDVIVVLEGSAVVMRDGVEVAASDPGTWSARSPRSMACPGRRRW